MKTKLLFFSLLLLSTISYAQIKISGNVKDNAGESLPGVNVIAVGTTVGISTDFDGNFEFNVPDETQEIEFSFIGYSTQKISIESAQAGNVQITLEEDANVLEDIVLIGYGTQKKSDITGSISSVDSKNLEDQPVADAAILLQGRAAGVQVTQTSGAPGASISVKVRGTGTVGDSSPLYVVDGIFLNNIDHINSSDIASMEVLKDASSTAIYGSRGANGVILITTKTGNTEYVSVKVEAMAGMQSVWQKPDLMNSSDWLKATNTARINGGQEALVLMAPSDNTSHTTDWFDAATRQGAIYKTNATISRGDDKSNTLFSLGYVKNEGVVIGSDYNRLNLRLNTNYTISKMFKTGVNLSVSNATTSGISSSNISGILINTQRIDPLTPIIDPATGDYASTPYSDLVNPIAAANRDVRIETDLLFLANTYLQFEPIKGLAFKTSFSVNMSRSKDKTYLPTYDYVGGDRNLTNSLEKGYSDFNGWLTENTVNYNFMVGEDHNFDLLAGFTAQQDQNEYLIAKRNNIPGDTDELQYISASTDQESTNAWNSGTDIRMYSYLGRLNYNYANKYYLTASIRRDGSSVFGPDMRFGNFPSLSLGWKLRNEKFMDFLSDDTVNHIMIRTGWGRVGNANIPPYGYTATLQTKDSKVEYSYVFSGQEYAGLAPVKMANKKMQWETVESTNIGLDMAFFASKITFSFDYFVKNTKDMLVQVPVPTYAGFDGSPYVNAGTVQNKGFEIDLGYNGNVGEDFRYSVNFNISHIKNEVTYLGGGQPIAGGSASFVGTTTRTEEGHPIGAFYGYQVAGVFQSQDEVDASPQAGEGIGAGDFKFKDQWTDKDEDGVMEEPDGIIDGHDRTFIGTPHPDFFYGLNIDMAYKGFDVKLFFQGQQGNDIFNAFKYYNHATNKTYALTNDYNNHWTADNKSNEMFGLNSATVDKNLRVSDFYIEDGSYLRLKNMQIGYTFTEPTKWLSNVRVYFSGQNLFTITKYSGLDPEVGGGSLNTGLDYGTYPQSRVLSFGANLSF
jgi:TonB-linked SusC/RagA family outer membrane protein